MDPSCYFAAHKQTQREQTNTWGCLGTFPHLVSPRTAGQLPLTNLTGGHIHTSGAKLSVTAETFLTLIPEQRGPCLCLVPSWVPQPWSVKKQRALCDQRWRANPSSGPALLCSPCWGGWVSFSWGKTLRCDLFSISSSWAAWDSKGNTECSIFLLHCKHQEIAEIPYQDLCVLWNYS